MLVDHLLEAGGSGAMVPWYNVRRDLFLDKVSQGQAGTVLRLVFFLSRFARLVGILLSCLAW